MGSQIMALYQEAEKSGGLKATMRLAMKTGITSDKANATPDTPETIQKLKLAWESIKKEL
ncbi:MAG: hypothetical protein ABIJ45_01170 [Candidatus Zixiibacteriota bacterium]